RCAGPGNRHRRAEVDGAGGRAGLRGVGLALLRGWTALAAPAAGGGVHLGGAGRWRSATCGRAVARTAYRWAVSPLLGWAARRRRHLRSGGPGARGIRAAPGADGARGCGVALARGTGDALWADDTAAATTVRGRRAGSASHHLAAALARRGECTG